MTWQTVSTSSAQTEQLGEQLGRQLKGREVIELNSDLGGGKTTFVRGLARGMGSPDVVNSPTFMISRVYTAGDLKLYHYDFYRLPEAGMAGAELEEVEHDPTAVVVVEWGDVVHNILPDKRLIIQLKMVVNDQRQLIFHYPKELSYLILPLTTN